MDGDPFGFLLYGLRDEYFEFRLPPPPQTTDNGRRREEHHHDGRVAGLDDVCYHRETAARPTSLHTTQSDPGSPDFTPPPRTDNPITHEHEQHHSPVHSFLDDGHLDRSRNFEFGSSSNAHDHFKSVGSSGFCFDGLFEVFVKQSRDYRQFSDDDFDDAYYLDDDDDDDAYCLGAAYDDDFDDAYYLDDDDDDDAYFLGGDDDDDACVIIDDAVTGKNKGAVEDDNEVIIIDSDDEEPEGDGADVVAVTRPPCLSNRTDIPIVCIVNPREIESDNDHVVTTTPSDAANRPESPILCDVNHQEVEGADDDIVITSPPQPSDVAANRAKSPMLFDVNSQREDNVDVDVDVDDHDVGVMSPPCPSARPQGPVVCGVNYQDLSLLEGDEYRGDYDYDSLRFFDEQCVAFHEEIKELALWDESYVPLEADDKCCLLSVVSKFREVTFLTKEFMEEERREKEEAKAAAKAKAEARNKRPSACLTRGLTHGTDHDFAELDEEFFSRKKRLKVHLEEPDFNDDDDLVSDLEEDSDEVVHSNDDKADENVEKVGGGGTSSNEPVLRKGKHPIEIDRVCGSSSRKPSLEEDKKVEPPRSKPRLRRGVTWEDFRECGLRMLSIDIDDIGPEDRIFLLNPFADLVEDATD